MRGSRLIRPMAVLAVLALLATACSKPKDDDVASSAGDLETTDTFDLVGPDGDELAPGEEPAEGESVEGAGAAGGDPNAPAGAPAPGGDPAPGAAVPINADREQQQAVGSRIKPQSTEKRNSHPGITDDQIRLTFSIDATSCGVSVVNALTAAGGALPTQGRYYRASPTTQDKVVAENRESIELMVRYWNEHAFEEAEDTPAVRELMGNDPEHPFYGRRLVHNVIDGGSNQCPDKTTAAARQAVEDRSFIVYNNFEGSSPAGANNMAKSLSAAPADRRPMHFGTLWGSDETYTRHAPFSWTQFATGTNIVRQKASYICSRVRTGEVPGRSPMVTDAKKRVFGLVHPNDENTQLLAKEFKGYLNEYCGGNIIAQEVQYDGQDFGKAQRDNTNLIVQLKLAGVTSVLMLTEPIQPLFQLQQATRQEYFPEWIFSSHGYSDSNTVQRLYPKDQTKHSFGVTQLGVYGGFGFGSGDPFAMYHTYHRKSPNSGKDCDPSSAEGMDHDPQYCKAPTSLVTWYYSMLPSIGGILFAGPDPTPQNVTNGLQAYPTTRYGGSGPTSDPRPALVGAGPGKHGFIVDATEWRWRPDFTSPPPEEKAGWVEYPDCMRHYLQWPNQLAPNWETDGPNYNAWCGDENGYPRVLDSDKR